MRITVGEVAALFRYPVKSMRGEPLEAGDSLLPIREDPGPAWASPPMFARRRERSSGFSVKNWRPTSVVATARRLKCEASISLITSATIGEIGRVAGQGPDVAVARTLFATMARVFETDAGILSDHYLTRLLDREDFWALRAAVRHRSPWPQQRKRQPIVLLIDCRFPHLPAEPVTPLSPPAQRPGCDPREGVPEPGAEVLLAQAGAREFEQLGQLGLDCRRRGRDPGQMAERAVAEPLAEPRAGRPRGAGEVAPIALLLE